MNLPNGHLLQNGKYRLTHIVGQGGFGITYKGTWFTEVKGPLGTIKTEVPICVKEYFFKDYCYRDPESYAVRVHSETGRVLFDKFKEKLIKEAKILSEVHHPHIVNVLEVFEENDTAYIAMEYISGNSLKYMMDKEGVLPEAKVLKYVHQIGEALRFVHEKNILHLDIKPSNILIDQSGKARLIDFGVSKRYDIEQQETSTTMLTLSKGFASIEQYDNEGTQSFSPCPDIYSLGATVYNLLTGKIPTESILRATRPLPSPSDLNPAISAKTERAIIKAMQIIPADRFQSISEMLAELDRPQINEEVVEKNNISSPEYLEGDETTILFTTRLPKSKEAEEDETVLNNVDPALPSKKKKRKATVISLLIIIFASIGSAVALFVQRNKTAPPAATAEMFNTTSQENTDSVQGLAIPDVIEESNTPEVVEEQPTSVEPDIKSVVNDVEQPETPVEPIIPEEQIKAEYNALIVSGKRKMDATDFEGAEADFAKAKAVKLTEEAIRLELECANKKEEQRIANRRALYEEKKRFGNMIIVRKKETMLYGAIDVNAEERIKCEYVSPTLTEQGHYAFSREDGLLDIYNADGNLIGEGLSSY